MTASYFMYVNMDPADAAHLVNRNLLFSLFPEVSPRVESDGSYVPPLDMEDCRKLGVTFTELNEEDSVPEK